MEISDKNALAQLRVKYRKVGYRLGRMLAMLDAAHLVLKDRSEEDLEGRTHEDVLQVVDAAIALAREGEVTDET